MKGMAKKVVHVDGAGGIQKKRIIKRDKKKTIHKVMDYLLSDCYLFAPLISPSLFNSSRPPRKGSSFFSDIEFRERTKDNRTLLKKIEDYLKSDCYMYAPLIAPQSFRGHVKKVTMEASTTTLIRRGDEVVSESAANLTKEKRICTADLVEATVLDQPNATPKESSKCAMYPNGRSSLSVSGNA